MKLIFIIFILLVTACTVAEEPIAVTRVVGTAVPTLTTTPTGSLLPAAIATVVSLPTSAETTIFVPPTGTPTTVATPTPLIPLSEFLANLQDKLNARDFESLREMMPARFLLGTHPSQRHNPVSTHAVEFLAYSYVPWVEPAIVIREENIVTDLTEPFAVGAIFRGEQNITAVLPSSGWG